MYLSRLILNPRSRQVQSEIADPYQMHRTILSAFPARLPEDERVLFRLELSHRADLPALLVQSRHPPNWGAFLDSQSASYLLPARTLEGIEENPAVKSVQLSFSPGQQLLFRLRANPTVKRSGKRYGLYRENEQIEWLRRKVDQAGSELLSARTSQPSRVQGKLYRDQKRHKMQFCAVTFEGLLVVRRPQALLQAVRTGIGSGKGLGFGLLSLAPAR